MGFQWSTCSISVKHETPGRARINLSNPETPPKALQRGRRHQPTHCGAAHRTTIKYDAVQKPAVSLSLNYCRQMIIAQDRVARFIHV